MKWASIAAVALAVSPGAAFAQQIYDIDVPAGPLGAAVKRLAVQTGASIALADPDLARVRTGRVAGRMSAREALRRLLRGKPVAIVAIDASTFRLVVRREASPRAPAPRRKPVGPDRGAKRIPSGPDIVVTAAKNGTRASDYPGSIRVVTIDDLSFREAGGTGTIERAVTALSSTRLGSGKEKLFLRGVGDSSFNGQTQATVGQYFGEARVNYSGPDPDLRLYDVAQVEVLLGPQGSLYGAGTMGGIIRIEPNRPDPKAFASETLLSLSLTSHGDPGGEAAAMVNQPLGWADGAVRLVGYHVRSGGYVDDPSRAVRDVNKMEVSGARASLALSPAPDWRMEIGALVQHIDGQDAAYVERGRSRLARWASVTQPFSNRFRLAEAVLRHETGDIEATATLSVSHGRLDDRFDAADASNAGFFSRHDASNVVSGEARIRRGGAAGFAWVIGGAFVDSRARLQTSLHGEAGPLSLIARTTIAERTLFGEISRRCGPLMLSVGARGGRWESRSRGLSQSSDLPGLTEQRDQGWRFLPAVSATVALPGDLQLFLRHASGYRPPGGSASPGGVVVLDGDRYRAMEVGLRLSPDEELRFAGEISFSVGRWRDVQADILDSLGNLRVGNIGDAKTLSIDAAWTWKPLDRFDLSGGFTANEAWISEGTLGTIIVGEGRLPNIPDINARLALHYSGPRDARLPFRLGSTLRYVGRSSAGIGALLDRRQGGYAELDADASLAWGRAEFFVKGSNLLDGAGNRFALGSIAQIGVRDQYVPQVPRTVTVGVRIR